MAFEVLEESDTARMADDEIRTFLTDQGVGVLGVADDGVPYMLPMSFGFDGDAAVYFLFLLFGTESRKEQLANQSDRARLLVWAADSMHAWRSVTVTGPLEAVPEDEWDQLREAMENAWHPSLFSGADPMRGVAGYRLQVEEWAGIENAR